jgi:vacuolar-type H+-ATPase subunit I/STV1
MASQLELLFAPAVLTMRALDDLHDLAEASRWVIRRRDQVEATVEELERQLSELIAVQREAVETQRALAHLQQQLLEEVIKLETSPRADAALRAMEDVRHSLETLVDTAQPLQGAAESIGRVADRLPGKGRRDDRKP